MRVIHTADLHLGRTLHGASLLDDQAHLLSQFIDLAKQEKPDVIIVAGDVYDRAVPPVEAVQLLDDTLHGLVAGIRVPVIVIAGNHDGPGRISFASRLLAGQGLHIMGGYVRDPSCVIVEDRHGPVRIYALPYAEPAVVRHCLGRQDVDSHQMAMQCSVEGVWQQHPKGQRAVAVAHCFVNGGRECESERPISIGGVGSIDPRVFDGFNYVALGHLHRPQTCDGSRAWYSGSLMRYSFNEVDHDKAVLLIDIDARGQCSVQQVQLVPRRQVRRIEGHFEQIIADAVGDPAPGDYLMVTLLDQGPIFDAMGKLRMAYPNVLHVDRPALTPSSSGVPKVDHRKMDETRLFDAFFKDVTGEQLTSEQSAALAAVVEQVRRADREVQA